MATILCIESSAQFGSVALMNGDQLIGELSSKEDRSHSRLLASQIKSLVEENSSFSKLDAVAVSAGPGSYTGLRIGVSLAKGMCFALNIPLIAISTLEIIARSESLQVGEWVCATVHARRSEVYAAVYDHEFKPVMKAQPLELPSVDLENICDGKSVLFCGNGSPIVQENMAIQNARFIADTVPEASSMGGIAFNSYIRTDFVNLEDFEPEYLKPVYTTTPKAH